MGGTGESIDFEKKPDVDEIMIRSLDLTVEPDTTYRFRVRTVAYNPNLGREDVSPGVDTKTVELNGPWSEPTEEVTMPPDVATYALNREPNVPRKLDQVNFEVARWTPEDGVTIVKRFPAAPGELIGEVSSVAVPIADGEGKKSVTKKIDFNSHQLVLDVMGGEQPIPPLGPGTGGRLPVPALSLVVRRDGAVVIRNQANDLHDQVRKDMADNFSRDLKTAEEEKKKKKKGGAAQLQGLERLPIDGDTGSPERSKNGTGTAKTRCPSRSRSNGRRRPTPLPGRGTNAGYQPAEKIIRKSAISP